MNKHPRLRDPKSRSRFGRVEVWVWLPTKKKRRKKINPVQSKNRARPMAARLISGRLVKVSRAHDPRSEASRLGLEPLLQQQRGCRVGYQARAAENIDVKSLSSLRTGHNYNHILEESYLTIQNFANNCIPDDSLGYKIEKNMQLCSLLSVSFFSRILTY